MNNPRGNKQRLAKQRRRQRRKRQKNTQTMSVVHGAQCEAPATTSKNTQSTSTTKRWVWIKWASVVVVTALLVAFLWLGLHRVKWGQAFEAILELLLLFIGS